MVFCTNSPVFCASSGPAYCTVIGRRNMYERVMLMPSQALFTVSRMPPTYSEIGIKSPVGKRVDAVAGEANVVEDLAHEDRERNQPRDREEADVQHPPRGAGRRLAL